MFVLETILTEGIAQLSYLVADTEVGIAAVIDPRTDAEIYEQEWPVVAPAGTESAERCNWRSVRGYPRFAFSLAEWLSRC